MQLQDIEQVAQIEKECFKSPWSKSEFLQLLNLNDVLAIVWLERVESGNLGSLEEDEQVIGYGIAILGAGLKPSSTIHIANLAVKPGYRRKEIGSALLSYMIDYAKENYPDVGEAVLEVRTYNKAAINLYKKFGFKEQGIKKWYYPDGDDAVVMRKALDTRCQVLDNR